MIPAIRAEFRKLMTLRSTYVIIGSCIAITVFFAFYLEGYRSTADVALPTKLASAVTSAAQALGLFIALAGVLLVTHEYRYNTIMYTLSAARSRTQVLLAKIVVVSVFSILLTLFVCSLAPWLTQLGLQAKGLSLVPQDFPIFDLLMKSAFYGWGYSMIALIIAFIVRNQVGALGFLFLFPGLGELLLGLLLKNNAIYLPFSALGSVIRNGGAMLGQVPFPLTKSVGVVLAYIVGGWLVAWILLMRRDAS